MDKDNINAEIFIRGLKRHLFWFNKIICLDYVEYYALQKLK